MFASVSWWFCFLLTNCDIFNEHNIILTRACTNKFRSKHTALPQHAAWNYLSIALISFSKNHSLLLLPILLCSVETCVSLYTEPQNLPKLGLLARLACHDIWKHIEIFINFWISHVMIRILSEKIASCRALVLILDTYMLRALLLSAVHYVYFVQVPIKVHRK